MTSRVCAAIALALTAVTACDARSDPGSATTVPTTTSAPTHATPTTSTASSTSTAAERPDFSFAEPGDPEWRILFSLPAGPDGVTYEGGFDDWMLTGPQALSVARDGSVWIADTNGRRLLHLSGDGTALATISADTAGVGGLIDVAAVDDGVWGLEVVPAIRRHRLVLFDDSGRLVDVHDLPDGLHLRNGLSGIGASPDGRLWIELEGGAVVYSAFDADGAFSPEAVDGYEIAGVTLHPVSGPIGGMVAFRIGDTTLERPVREVGGIELAGGTSGAVALTVSDVMLDESGAITVDVEILIADLTGDVVGTATYPLDQVTAEAYVPQHFVALGPDGRLIALMPNPDALEVIELSIFRPGDRR